jgi:hypothetical protein
MSKITTASEIRAKTQQEVKAPSGATYLIRKVTLREFMPRSLVGLFVAGGEDGAGALSPEKVMKEIINNPDEIFAIERTVLLAGVIGPELSATQTSNDDEKLFVDDLPPDDRVFLFNTISEFSGYSLEKLKDTGKFPSGKRNLGTPRAGRQVLRKAPVGANGPQS